MARERPPLIGLWGSLIECENSNEIEGKVDDSYHRWIVIQVGPWIERIALTFTRAEFSFGIKMILCTALQRTMFHYLLQNWIF